MNYLTDILWMLSTCALSTGVLKNPLRPSSSIVEALFWEQGRGGAEEEKESEQREENETRRLFGSAVVKGSEWERGPCSQPHGPFSLWIMEAFLWFLTPLSHAGNGQPSIRHSQQTRSPCWIIEFYTQESHPCPWPGPLLHVALTETLPGSTSYPGEGSKSVQSARIWWRHLFSYNCYGPAWSLIQVFKWYTSKTSPFQVFFDCRNSETSHGGVIV